MQSKYPVNILLWKPGNRNSTLVIPLDNIVNCVCVSVSMCVNSLFTFNWKLVLNPKSITDLSINRTSAVQPVNQHLITI